MFLPSPSVMICSVDDASERTSLQLRRQRLVDGQRRDVRESGLAAKSDHTVSTFCLQPTEQRHRETQRHHGRGAPATVRPTQPHPRRTHPIEITKSLIVPRYISGRRPNVPTTSKPGEVRNAARNPVETGKSLPTPTLNVVVSATACTGTSVMMSNSKTRIAQGIAQYPCP